MTLKNTTDSTMLNMWKDISKNYWQAKDLEEKQRNLLALFLKDKKWEVLELWCWNGKILHKIHQENKKLWLYWIDYSTEMIQRAQADYWDVIHYMNWDIRDISKNVANKQFDIVYALNTLHNLPDKQLIYSTFDTMYTHTKPWWYLIFDIRNSLNPFIWYGYRKNRKKGLSFWTLNPFWILRFFKKYNVSICIKKWIYYKNRDESLFTHTNKILRFLYSIYLKITSITIFSPYIFIILQKK